MKKILLLSLFILFSSVAHSQVLINELMYNAEGGGGAPYYDGSASNSPNTGEFVEFHSPTFQDISCWSVTDGDIVFTFSPGTSISSGGYLTLGGAANRPAPDYRWDSADVYNSFIGILSNSAEQLALFDNFGNFQDGVIWGGGVVIPYAMSSQNIFGCPVVPLNIPLLTDGAWEDITPSDNCAGGLDGFTMARIVDGASTWEKRSNNLFCNYTVTYDTSNNIGILHIAVESFSVYNDGEYTKIELMLSGGFKTASLTHSLDGKEFVPVEDFYDEQYVYTEFKNEIYGYNFFRFEFVDKDGEKSFSDVESIFVENLPECKVCEIYDLNGIKQHIEWKGLEEMKIFIIFNGRKHYKLIKQQ